MHCNGIEASRPNYKWKDPTGIFQNLNHGHNFIIIDQYILTFTPKKFFSFLGKTSVRKMKSIYRGHICLRANRLTIHFNFSSAVDSFRTSRGQRYRFETQLMVKQKTLDIFSTDRLGETNATNGNEKLHKSSYMWGLSQPDWLFWGKGTSNKTRITSKFVIVNSAQFSSSVPSPQLSAKSQSSSVSTQA